MPRRAVRSSMDCCVDRDQQAVLDDADYHADADALFETDQFRMFHFKILPCAKRQVHDWTVCPFAHPGEKARRRDPRVYSYLAIPCPEVKHNRPCQAGDNCPYAHSVFEYWLHPSRYRTQLCQHGTNCKRAICFFAHTPAGLRVPDASHLKLNEAATPSASSSGASSIKSSSSLSSSDSIKTTSSMAVSDHESRRSSNSSGRSGSRSPDVARAAQHSRDQRSRQLAMSHQQGQHMLQQQQLMVQQLQQQEQQRALHEVQTRQLQQQQQQQRDVFDAQEQATRMHAPFHIGELLSALPPVQAVQAPSLALPLSPNSCMLDEVVMPPLHHCSPPLSPVLGTASPTSVLCDTFNCAPVQPALRPGLLPVTGNVAAGSYMPGGTTTAKYSTSNAAVPDSAMMSVPAGCGTAASLVGGLSMDDVAQLVSMAQQDSGMGGNQLLVGLVNVLVHQLQQQQVMV